MAIEYLKRGKPEADRAEDDAKTAAIVLCNSSNVFFPSMAIVLMTSSFTSKTTRILKTMFVCKLFVTKINFSSQ